MSFATSRAWRSLIGDDANSMKSADDSVMVLVLWLASAKSIRSSAKFALLAAIFGVVRTVLVISCNGSAGKAVFAWIVDSSRGREGTSRAVDMTDAFVILSEYCEDVVATLTDTCVNAEDVIQSTSATEMSYLLSLKCGTGGYLEGFSFRTVLEPPLKVTFPRIGFPSMSPTIVSTDEI